MFRSKLENLMPAEELLFDATPGFKGYKRYLSHAIAHPAKINMKLLKFLIQNFTEKGDVVLDPMAGSGSTGVVAALHGRNAVCVDLEEKFYKWMEKARKKVERQQTLTPKGKIKNICGDARKLSELLKKADVVLTSPPYSQTISKHAGGKFSLKNVGISTKTARSYDAIVTSPPYSESMTKKRKGYTTHKNLSKTRHMGEDTKDENIGNLPHGKLDTIITSPPYGESYLGGGDSEKRKERLIKAGHDPKEFLGGKARNAVLKHYPEVDAVITSPPYGEAQKGSGIAKKGYQGNKHSPTDLVGNRSYMPDKFESEDNISRLPIGKVDAVITSPPYAESLQKHNEKTEQTVKEKLGSAFMTKGRLEAQKRMQGGYSEKTDKENIGNLPFQPDAIITSPPYAHESTVAKPTKLEKQGKFKMGHSNEEPYTRENYRKWKKHKGGNIGKKKLFVRVPCKPEEAQFHDTRKGRKDTVWEYTKEVEATAETIQQIQNLKSRRKGKSETYLEAMLKVYSEMWKVLKPQGLCIIVIKPFIRNKQVVDLPYHTWLLLKKAGFKLERLFKLQLKNPSFWRILYRKKYPNVPRIKHEYILICQKVL